MTSARGTPTPPILDVHQLTVERGSTLILVTHHVEEIMPAFKHVLVMKQGRVLASGPKTSTLTGPTLTEAFGDRIRISRTPGGRYTLGVGPGRGRVV